MKSSLQGTLFTQKMPFPLNHLPFTLTMESTDATSRADNPMTGDIGRKRVALQCLANGLGTAAVYLMGKFLVGDCGATRHVQQGKIHLALKVCDVGVGLYYRAYIGHDGS